MSIGEVDVIVKPIRVLSITRSQEMRRKISGIEYVEAVYSGATPVADLPVYSSLALVTGLIVKEIWEVAGGSGRSGINLSWRGDALSWNVFIKEEGKNWIKLATVLRPNYTVYNLPIGTYYIFAVSVTDNPLDGETESLTFTGDPEIDAILSRYRRPSPIGAA